jgi:hypothetical protein
VGQSESDAYWFTSLLPTGSEVALAGGWWRSPGRPVAPEFYVLVLQHPPLESPGRRATTLLLQDHLYQPGGIMPNAWLDLGVPLLVFRLDSSLSRVHGSPLVGRTIAFHAIVRPRAGSLYQLSRSSFSR